MYIEIKKLTHDLLEDYLDFFETDAHADNEGEDRCYCVCWCSVDHRVVTDFSSPKKRRELAIQYVNSGAIQGYLAYCDGKVVGWCNANTKSECLYCTSWLRFMTHIQSSKTDDDNTVKAIYCFTIAPQMKRKGIATKLLERVCNDAADDGFKFVEAYPNKEFVNMFRDFMGPTDLYKKLGFTVYKEMNDVFVVRKQLKQNILY